VQIEGLSQLKNPVTSLGIENTTFCLVTTYAAACPSITKESLLIFIMYIYIYVCIIYTHQYNYHYTGCPDERYPK
jgi:hypothetical protein